MELCCKSYASHHPQRVVAEGYLGFQRCADEVVFQIGNAVKGIDDFSKVLFVEAYAECVDGEVPALQVFLQGAFLNDGFPGIVAVAFPACPDKLYLCALVLHLCSAEVPEYGQVSSSAQA